MYPGQGSKSGFLKHLPCLFGEVNVDGRSALRWAVQAAALADASREHERDNVLVKQALDCYAKALAALSTSLREEGKLPDDYDLMTVVVLDLFEVQSNHNTRLHLPTDWRSRLFSCPMLPAGRMCKAWLMSSGFADRTFLALADGASRDSAIIKCKRSGWHFN